MSLYIVALCTFFILFPKMLFGLDYKNTDSLTTTPDKYEHFTIVYNVFIQANLFN